MSRIKNREGNSKEGVEKRTEMSFLIHVMYRLVGERDQPNNQDITKERPVLLASSA